MGTFLVTIFLVLCGAVGYIGFLAFQKGYEYWWLFIVGGAIALLIVLAQFAKLYMILES